MVKVKLNTTPWRHMGEWIFSWPWHQLEASGRLHSPATLIPGKEPQYSPDRSQSGEKGHQRMKLTTDICLVPRLTCGAIRTLLAWRLIKHTQNFDFYAILLVTEDLFYVCDNPVSGGSSQMPGNDGADPSPAVTVGAGPTAAGAVRWGRQLLGRPG
jgi:hypothetical protein